MVAQDERGVGGDESFSESLSKDVFSTYKCRSIQRGIEHPGDIAEASGLRCELHSRHQCTCLRWALVHAGGSIESIKRDQTVWTTILSSCSACLLPPADYPLWDSIGDGIVKHGLLSQLQLEGVMYASMKHLQWLPSGQRASSGCVAALPCLEERRCKHHFVVLGMPRALM